jgi:hypothetical protein
LCHSIWGENPNPSTSICRQNDGGGKSFFLEERPAPEQLQQVLENAGVKPALKLLAGETGGWLHVLHRVKDGRDIFFICNQNDKGPRREFRFHIHAAGEPECWDALRNEITAIPYTRTGENEMEFPLGMEPLETAIIVFQPKKHDRPMRIQNGMKPLGEIAVARELNPATVTSAPAASVISKPRLLANRGFSGCKWVWYPETNPAAHASSGTRYFRRSIVLPADRKIKRAPFILTADNDFVLYVNGREVGRCTGERENWKVFKAIFITPQLRPGQNVLAVAASKRGGKPGPAGLIGRFGIEFAEGSPFLGRIDKTWKTTDREEAGWNLADFDDTKWKTVQEIAPLGGEPWEDIDSRRQMTISPLAAADPFRGRFTIPAESLVANRRVCLEMDGLLDASAAVTINGEYAGGVIGKPTRLDVTAHAKIGENTLLIEPVAPKSIRVAIYPW